MTTARKSAKKPVQKYKKYAVRVWFWNGDSEYEWHSDFVINHPPTKAWMDKMYDGVSVPQKFKILMRK